MRNVDYVQSLYSTHSEVHLLSVTVHNHPSKQIRMMGEDVDLPPAVRVCVTKASVAGCRAQWIMMYAQDGSGADRARPVVFGNLVM